MIFIIIYASLLHIAGMKNLLLLLSLICAHPADSIGVMFWNLENFFDWRDGGMNPSDAEFSSSGERRWTSKRFHSKCDAVAKSILWISDRHGGLPDIICLAEVENRFVLKRLLGVTALKKSDYGIVHYDSPDPRGIDVALLYRKSRLDTVRTRAVHIPGLETRDILLAQFRCPGGDSLAVTANHHPSKYGGAASEAKREAAVSMLRHLTDSLTRAGWVHQVATGDFNDTPDSPVYDRLEPSLVNISWKGASGGSIRFNGKWELIDQCLVTPELAPRSSMEVIRIPFLMTRDKAYGGEKPLRTYVGPRYAGGVSDHCPILSTIIL